MLNAKQKMASGVIAIMFLLQCSLKFHTGPYTMYSQANAQQLGHLVSSTLL